jgi:hypothetical protein
MCTKYLKKFSYGIYFQFLESILLLIKQDTHYLPNKIKKSKTRTNKDKKLTLVTATLFLIKFN